MNSSLSFHSDKLRVKLLAFSPAEVSVFERAKRKYKQVFNPDEVEFVNANPDVLMILTGGCEHMAVEHLQKYRFYLLIANRDANAWAAATEIKAWMNQHNIASLLVNADSPDASLILSEYYRAVRGVKRLHGQRLGVVGRSSEWLVASQVSPVVLQSRLGIEQVDIDWNEIVFDEINGVSPEFSALFGKTDSERELYESGKVYEGLASLIPFYKLNALTVECFPLVKQTGHTACLALSKLNMDAIPAACEADICSAAAMMLATEVCGVSPWMANTVLVDGTRGIFAHCSVPVGLLSDFKLDTHFETGKGLAIAGNFSSREFTIFRFDNSVSKLFVTLASALKQPKSRNACRTQLEVELTPEASRYFTRAPFGNHHLLLPGNYVNRLMFAARLLQLEVVVGEG